jgi:hypothetical protein
VATDLSGATPSDPEQAPAAEPESSTETTAEATAATTPPPAAPKGRRLSIRKPSVPKKHRARFVVVYVALAAAVAAGAVGIVLLTTGGSSSKSASGSTANGEWSTWKPTGGGLGAAQQIANFVGKDYKTKAGAQILTALAQTAKFPKAVVGDKGNVQVVTVPLGGIVVHTKKGDEATRIDTRNSTMYNLVCSAESPACKPSAGEAGLAQNILFRREVLELALYTFKYVPGVDNILTLLQPDRNKAPEVFYFRRADLESQLDVPVAKTLGSVKTNGDGLPRNVRITVTRVVSPHVYKFPGDVEPVITGEWVLFLRPAL